MFPVDPKASEVVGCERAGAKAVWSIMRWASQGWVLHVINHTKSNKQLYKSLSLQATTGRDDQAIPTLNISMSVKNNHFPLRTGDTGASTWTDYETAFPVTRSRNIPFFFNPLVQNSQTQQHYPAVYLLKILTKGNKGNISHSVWVPNGIEAGRHTHSGSGCEETKYPTSPRKQTHLGVEITSLSCTTFNTTKLEHRDSFIHL